LNRLMGPASEREDLEQLLTSAKAVLDAISDLWLDTSLLIMDLSELLQKNTLRSSVSSESSIGKET